MSLTIENLFLLNCSCFSVMDKLVKDIRQKVKDSKKFWSNLPFQICNHEDFSVPPGVEGNCWNGYAIDR